MKNVIIFIILVFLVFVVIVALKKNGATNGPSDTVAPSSLPDEAPGFRKTADQPQPPQQ